MLARWCFAGCCQASVAIEQLRARMFSNNAAGGWRNVTLSVPGEGNARIDAAYFDNPAQSSLQPHERRWIIWFLGNGELYEMMIPDLEKLASRAPVRGSHIVHLVPNYLLSG